jgi:hypothetical protein
VLLVGAVVLAFLWAATEWTAWQLGFRAQLGPAWFEFFGWPFYRPPAFFWWTTDWSLGWLRSRVWVTGGKTLCEYMFSELPRYRTSWGAPIVPGLPEAALIPSSTRSAPEPGAFTNATARSKCWARLLRDAATIRSCVDQADSPARGPRWWDTHSENVQETVKE